MFEVGKKQRTCIEQQDYEALEQAFSEMHRLMDEVRLRQQKLPDLNASQQAVEMRIERMRDWLERLQDQRAATQSIAEEMLRLNREEFRQIGRGRRAARGYKAAHATDARLYDGTR
jgi:predicted  nucleic acid-binding Zn-ribbon protein